MAIKGTEANFRINVEGNAADASKAIASSARLAAKSISSFETEVKSLSGDLRRLKGNSDEVKTAKEALRGKIDGLRTSASMLTVELNKQGTSYAAASKAVKSYTADVREGFKEAVTKLGGARADFGKALERLVPQSIRDRVAKVVGPAMKSVGDKMAAAKGAIGSSLGKAFGPAREAVGKAFTSISGTVGKSFIGPLISGLGKTFSALGSVLKPVASSVLPSLGSGLKLLGTLGVGAAAAAAAVAAAAIAGAAALIGFGLASADAAAKMQRQREALWGNAQDAKALGTQIQALAGKVPQGVEELNGMALALSKTRLSGKAVVSTMNAVAQVSGAVDATAGNKIQELITRGHRFGRMALNQLELEGTGLNFDEVAKEYAAGTKKSVAAAAAELRTGRAPIEAGAEALSRAAEKKFGKLNIDNAFSLDNAPKKFGDAFKSLMGDIDLKPISQGLKDAFAQLSPDAPLGAAVKSFMTTVGSGFADVVGKSIPGMVEGLKWLVVGALKVGTTFYEMKKQVKDAFAVGDWAGFGKALMVGFWKGILEGQGYVMKAIVSLGKSIKNGFTDEMKIKSPSKVFEKYGEHTTEGYAQGVERGSKRATGAVQGMVQMPMSGGGGGSGGGSSAPITVQINGVAGAAEMATPAFLSALSEAVRNGARAAGAAR
jgi:hypothetical protein